MLTKIKEDPHFLDTGVTMDESWVYCYDPELKCQSSAWVAKGEARPMKVAQPRAVGKVLLVSFFDAKGMVHYEYQQRTINRDLSFQTQTLNFQETWVQVPQGVHPTHG